MTACLRGSGDVRTYPPDDTYSLYKLLCRSKHDMLEKKRNKQLCGTYYKYYCSIVRVAKNQSVAFFRKSATYGIVLQVVQLVGRRGSRVVAVRVVLDERRLVVVVKLHHLLVLRRARLTTFLPYPKRSPSRFSTEHRKQTAGTTHRNAQIAPTTNPAATNPATIDTLLPDKNPERADTPCGSGSTNTNLRPGSCTAALVRLFGSKQYCAKQAWQNAERGRGGFVLLKRARSIAAHCVHLPKLGSGALVPGRKPPITFA